MSKMKPIGNRIMDRAWMRDGESIHTGEALMLACLVHTKGKGRKSRDMSEVQRIMRDKNLNKKS